MQEEVDIAITGEKLSKGNNFDITIYEELGDFTPPIDSKYRNVIRINNGKIYIKSEADEEIKKVAQGLGMEIAKLAISDENGSVKLKDVNEIKSYKIYGNTVEGASVGKIDEETNQYRIPVTVSGKNIARAQDVFLGANNYAETTLDNKNCVRYTASKNLKNKFYNFKENTQYTISFDYILKQRQAFDADYEEAMRLWYTDGTMENLGCGSIRDVWKHQVITSEANKTVSDIGTESVNYKSYIYVDIDTFQIEEGSVATAYEPYVEPRTYDIYLSEPLRGNDEVADYIDFEKGVVVRMVDEDSQTLTKPTEEKIDMPEIILHEGTNIITVDTVAKPSKIEIEY